MNPYQSFQTSLVHSSSYDWTGFVRDLPSILLEDKNLKELFLKYPFLDDKLEEITVELTDELYDDLTYWEFTMRFGFENEDKFYSLIYSRATEIFMRVVAKYVPADSQSFLTSFQDYSIVTIGDSTPSEEEIYWDDERWLPDGFQIREIKNAEKEFINFSFEKENLFTKFKTWTYIFKPVGDNQIVKPVPLVKTIEYFDPTIYEVIKKNPELLQTLDWRLFEEMLADILRRFNYTVELTKATKDGGIDIIAIKKDENFGLHKYLLQAKRYTHAVQVSPIRELLFLHDEYKATKSCLATTARFTSGAWKLAEKHKWKMELKDQQGILEWIDKIKIK